MINYYGLKALISDDLNQPNSTCDCPAVVLEISQTGIPNIFPMQLSGRVNLICGTVAFTTSHYSATLSSLSNCYLSYQTALSFTQFCFAVINCSYVGP